MSVKRENFFGYGRDNKSLPEEGSLEWREEIFKRAYCWSEGPFNRVVKKLNADFNVLVYLPGNCMQAAAKHVKDHSKSKTYRNRIKPVPDSWHEYFQHPGWNQQGDKEAVGGIDVLWNNSASIISRLRAWLTGKSDEVEGQRKFIYHNLDLLAANNGVDVYPSTAAQTALFTLIESTRNGVVLGLSDIDAGELPKAIERPFDEIIRLDLIPDGNFKYIIPDTLGSRFLGEESEGEEEMFWHLFSRLRFTNPVRAVKIMSDCATYATYDMMLNNISSQVRSIDFITPDDSFRFPDKFLDGFPAETISLIENKIIAPYRRYLSGVSTTDLSKNNRQTVLKKLPGGLILYGPPGTGKTQLVRWIARKIGLPIRILNAADIKASEFGKAEQNVHRVFREARRATPCIIVLDDADDLIPERSDIRGSVAGAERGIVNAMLQELEGIEGRLEGVLVIMTTNRYAALDSAAKRRLKMHVHIPYPLDRTQVGSVVRCIAGQFNIDISQIEEEEMMTFFMGWVDPNAGVGSNSTPADRKRIQKNLFAPSEIQQALLLLENPDTGEPPDMDDFSRMKGYYENRINVGADTAG